MDTGKKMVKNKNKYKMKDSKKTVLKNNIGNARNLLNTREASDYLGIKQKQLENMRNHKTGPKFIKSDRLCLYSKRDLDEWKKANKGGKMKMPLVADKLQDRKVSSVNKVKRIVNKVATEVAKVEEASKEFKGNVENVMQSVINETNALIDSKRGYWINKTDVAIFKNIVSVVTSLTQEIERLKIKAK